MSVPFLRFSFFLCAFRFCDIMKAPDTPDVDLLRAHFQHASLVEHLPPLAEYPTKTDYLDAFAVRGKVASLFLGEHLFITELYTAVEQRSRIEYLSRYVSSALRRTSAERRGKLTAPTWLGRGVLEQDVKQTGSLRKRMPTGVDNRAGFKNSIEAREAAESTTFRHGLSSLLSYILDSNGRLLLASNLLQLMTYPPASE